MGKLLSAFRGAPGFRGTHFDETLHHCMVGQVSDSYAHSVLNIVCCLLSSDMLPSVTQEASTYALCSRGLRLETMHGHKLS